SDDSGSDDEISFPYAEQPSLTLDTLNEGISTSQPIGFYIDLEEAAPTLLISLSSGKAGLDLGDPDVYVKYEGFPEAGEAPVFDCVSFNSPNSHETCIIDNPLAGRYNILIDAYEGADVTDATLLASTSLFASSELCADMVQVRIQEVMSEEAKTDICNTLIETKARFETVLNENLSADKGVPVPDDLNDITNINIFASLSNHMSWVEHLWDSDNSSGIYFETAPTEWYHDSTILTFNALEWSGGRSVIRSLAHEYVHALDGRYNKEGGYNSTMGWWTEGLAEYIGTYYQRPYQMLLDANQDTKYSLSDITTPTISYGSFYDWGTLAVSYMIEEHPDFVKGLIANMRAGEWQTVSTQLAEFSTSYQEAFQTWQSTTLVSNFQASALPLTLEEPVQINGRGGWVYRFTLSAATPAMTINTSGGSTNVDLWVSKDLPAHPAIDQPVLCSSTTESSNEENCVIENPEPGTYYVTVGSDFSGADILDVYLSACTGTDCSVTLPEPMTTITPVEPYLPHWPEKGSLGTCSLIESYGRSRQQVEGFTVSNTSEKDLQLYWINYSAGTKPSASFQTLAAGQTFNSDYWVIGDRMMIGDLGGNCLGVAIVNDSQNSFVADAEFAKDAVDEAPIPVATAEIGSCELLTSYTRGDGYAPEFAVHNQSSTPVTLAWVNNNDGTLYYGNYGTLELGDSYAHSGWAVGDRMALMSSEGQCYGVLDLNDSSNIFVIDETLFE
ncbi:hypothetical protein CWB72_19680, partial [Pseudoalteromonas phenolica]|uniref:collagenase n=1 Tax=Pseudoalteromonas phenolica TaxID=161398 RepID=UPI00110BAE8A